MFGLSPKLPLNRNLSDGFYGLTKTHKEMVKQNFKMLILTSPGERMMEPLFGVGLKRFLFEQDNSFIRSEIVSAINEQVGIYMPFIKIKNIEFESFENNPQLDPNYLYTLVEYIIVPLDEEDSLDIELSI